VDGVGLGLIIRFDEVRKEEINFYEDLDGTYSD